MNSETEKKGLSAAACEGYDAYLDNKPDSANPYESGSVSWDHWYFQGWRRAQAAYWAAIAEQEYP